MKAANAVFKGFLSMLRTLMLATALVGLSACGNSTPSENAQQATGPAFVVTDAYVRAPAGGRNVTGAYLTVVSNSNADAEIIGVSADRAGTAELHTHINDEGVMRMRPVETVELPAGGSAVFEPLHDHVMLFEVEDGLGEGDIVTLTLEIRSGEETELVSAEAEVRLRN